MAEPTAPEYYDRRASEYDDWYLGRGRYADLERPGFHGDVAAVAAAIATLPPAKTLDVALGTGFLTQHLRGDVTGLDRSRRMLEIAAALVPHAQLVEADALALPFPDDAFDRVLSGHFYGHLDVSQRATFLREVRRVAPELVIVDASARSGVVERWETRVLGDGSTWEVFKRYFAPEPLLEELGGGAILYRGPCFLAVRSPR